jgi:hypothetical protein
MKSENAVVDGYILPFFLTEEERPDVRLKIRGVGAGVLNRCPARLGPCRIADSAELQLYFGSDTSEQGSCAINSAERSPVKAASADLWNFLVGVDLHPRHMTDTHYTNAIKLEYTKKVTLNFRETLNS